MKTYYIARLQKDDLESLYKRKAIGSSGVRKTVEGIISRVRNEGDAALFKLAKKFDKADLDSLVVSKEEIAEATANLPVKLKDAYKKAAENIKKFHDVQLTGRQSVETMPGVTCFAEMRPIEKVGLYVPGGTAALPSTLLMLAIPAKLAGCKEIIICTPPGTDGKIPGSILYAADICGVDKIYKAGGAQAIAAMAYGTKTVPKTYKIFGPGNQYVTTAKMLVSTDMDGAAIDMPAGPTELLVVADEEARPDFVAADLLSQAEHGTDSQVILVSTSEKNAESILKQLTSQLDSLPRKEIARKTLDNSFVLIVKDVSQAIEFANRFAPEHLILNVKGAENYVDEIANAGSVFLGRYSTESAGDYASGTNHSLPTYGYARTYSGVSLSSFQKRITFQKLTKAGAANIAPIVSAMATVESLEGHKRAMEIRL
ncbi:MAG TPA: histidinol dehydrogenase [Candidatus Saccharimonadales bacterium]|nr:histidinol dehydrogenase [Candidatus Saccharimonadales bacterium]